MAKIATYLEKGISPMQPVINATPRANDADVGVILSEEKCLGYVNLRLNPDNMGNQKALNKVLGISLPDIEHVAVSNVTKITILGLSPNEWLIICEAGSEAELCQKLEKVLNGTHHLITDVSGGTTKLNIVGRHAQDLLEKGTYVDLHDSIFQADTLYATQIAHAPAVIIKNGNNDFTLIVRRSFSDHIARWAVDGAAEYGFSFS